MPCLISGKCLFIHDFEYSELQTTCFLPHANSGLRLKKIVLGRYLIDEATQTVDDRQEGNMVEEELRQALLSATVELESTRAVAQEQMARMEGEIAQLRSLLDVTARERDEARSQSHNALLLLHSSHHHHQQQQQLCVKVSDAAIQNAHKPQCSIPVADSSEGSSIVSSPPTQAVKGTTELDIGSMLLGSNRELPKKGRLLEAVMKAGPLLQNLLLAGPLPQWRHPPPPLRSFEIPPVSIGGVMTTNSTNTTSTVGILKNEEEDEGQKKNRKRKEVEKREMPLAVENGGSSRSSSSWSTSPNKSNKSSTMYHHTLVAETGEYYC